MHRPAAVAMEASQRRPRSQIIIDGGAGGAGRIIFWACRALLLRQFVGNARILGVEERVRDLARIAVRLDKVAALDVSL